MPGAIGRTVGMAATKFVVAMMPRVPAIAGHVDAAAKGEAVVDHDDLLVVRGAEGMGAVEADMDARMQRPARHRAVPVRQAAPRLDRQ